ncbi:MAG: hypothetical protein HWE26_04375 [Alteromonadaceae bacterium]|nr:hypothetical protein [Alteromonadaceae bacterium]
MIRHFTLFVALWAVSCFLTVAWSKWGILSSIDQQYQQAYTSVTPSKIYSGGVNNDAVSFMLNKIRLELDTLQIDSLVPVLRECRITNISVEPEVTFYSRLFRRLQWELVLNDPHHHLSYAGAAECQINWLNLLGSQFVLCLLIAVTLYYLPHPLTRQETALIAQYQALNWSRADIDALQQLQPDQQQWVQAIANHPKLSAMPLKAIISNIAGHNPCPVSIQKLKWLALAYKCTENPQQSFAVAFDHYATLAFDIPRRVVVIHGITIKLTPTPYFYYLWYALKRQNTETGWVLNPLTTKADHLLAEQLIALMEQHGGHAKAINDLRRNGLMAKKLDQNRNKIKEEITAVLGEDLASAFLFESRRDGASLRYDYRIALSSKKIETL